MKKKQLQWAINPVTGQIMAREIEQDDKDRTKKRLKKRWKKLCNDFRDELLRMWGLDAKRGRWQGKDGICVYNYGDDEFTIDIENIIYCVLCDVTREQYEEWQDYVRNASELDFIPLELHPWMRRNV